MHLDKINKLIEKRSLSYFLPYESVSDDYFFNLDSHVGFSFECAPLLAGGEDGEDTLEAIYTSLPVGSVVQINLLASKYIKFITDRYQDSRKEEFRTATNERVNFLRSGTKESILSEFDLLIRNFRCIFSCQVPATLPKKEIIKARLGLMRNLKHMKLNPHPMKSNHLIEFASELINHDYDDESMRRQYNPYEEIRDQIVKNDIVTHIERDHIQLGDTFVSSMSFSQLPERWALFRMKEMIGDETSDNRSFPYPFMLTQTVVILDHEKRENTFNWSRKFTKYQEFFGKLIPRIGYKNEAYDRVAHELEKTNSKFVKSYLNIITWANSYENLCSQLQDIRGYYSNLKFVAEQDHFINLPIFVSSFPMGYKLSHDSYLRRTETRTTKEAATFAPIISDWGGSGTPAFQLISRMGQIMPLDLFDSEAFGAIISGKTGGGKSFFVGDMLEAYAARGYKQFIIDAGRSYQNACEKYGGQYIDFVDTYYCLNPFTQIKNIEDLNEHMMTLQGAIGEMISPKDPISDLQYSLIEQAIRETYLEYDSETTPTRIRDYMKSHEDVRYHDMALMMQSFCVGGTYEKYFNGPNNIDFNNKLVVLELDGLKNKDHLQSVVLYLMIIQIQQELYNMFAHGERGLCYFDECKDIIDKPNVNKFLIAAYRKFRKYESAPISIFQGLNDVYESKGGRIMLENSDWIFLLRQKEEALNNLLKDDKLLLSKRDIDLIKSAKSAKQVNNQFSEVFVYSEIGRGMGRLVVDRFNQLVRTSKSSEKAVIERVQKQLNCTSEEAIRHIVEDEKRHQLKGMSHAS